MSKRNKRTGFTLVEMLVVVTLIAIVATIAIALLGGARQDAAEAVNFSNIKHMTSMLGAYQQLHDGALPNHVDSLIASNKLANATYETIATATQFLPQIDVVSNPGTVLYIGKDDNMDGVSDNPDDTSKGLYGAAWSGSFASLTVSKLTENDINRLRDLGITTVRDFTTNGSLFNGTETYSIRVLKVGDPVVVVDPRTSRNGIGAYKSFGYNVLDDKVAFPVNQTGLLDEGRATAMQNARFLVFGIGPNSTIVGSRKAGVTEAPASKVLPAGYYNHYLMVVKIGNPPVDVSANLAGVMDPAGNTARSAESWATRTGN